MHEITVCHCHWQLQRSSNPPNSLTDGAIYFDDDDFHYLYGAIPIRCGSGHSNLTYTTQQRFIIPMLGYGHSEFLIDEYEQVKNQYHAIEDSDTRDAFVEMRQQLIEQIEEVNLKSLADIIRKTQNCLSMLRMAYEVN